MKRYDIRLREGDNWLDPMSGSACFHSVPLLMDEIPTKGQILSFCKRHWDVIDVELKLEMHADRVAQVEGVAIGRHEAFATITIVVVYLKERE